MKQERAALVLRDPLAGGSRFDALPAIALMEDIQKLTESNKDTALVFDESGRCFACGAGAGDALSRAQAALQWTRERFGWVCVAASGGAAWIALALAAQLPVERLALWQDAVPQGRELARIEAFARRNLSLVAAEILLVDVPAADAHRLARRVSRHCEIRRMEGRMPVAEDVLGAWR